MKNSHVHQRCKSVPLPARWDCICPLHWRHILQSSLQLGKDSDFQCGLSVRGCPRPTQCFLGPNLSFFKVVRRKSRSHGPPVSTRIFFSPVIRVMVPSALKFPSVSGQQYPGFRTDTEYAWPQKSNSVSDRGTFLREQHPPEVTSITAVTEVVWSVSSSSWKSGINREVCCPLMVVICYCGFKPTTESIFYIVIGLEQSTKEY